ncbi:MAG: pyridoxamine 5'-phosphate oxidase family protein [Helicobacteraceae bacterium]|jgi:uncharacterized pyridoxamine 5'-phosphate oxidase family protein|nr:pyridoxamine 5'-phosphate oxidase family protein [Helicobacteraceae bacterium]
MSAIDKYQEVLGNTNVIALATSVDNVPDVRIVNFIRDQKRPNVLLFASDRTNRKVAQFAKNNAVAFTSVPKEGDIPHVRSNNAVVTKSAQTIGDLKRSFIDAIPGYDATLEAIADTLDVFEIHIKQAIVITGFEEPDLITF